MENVEPWQLLAALGLLLAILEFFTPSFFALPAGVAFLVTAGLALVTQSWNVLLLALALNLAAVYFVFQRFIWPKLQKEAPKTNADAMAGQIGTVSEAIDPTTGRGYVKLYGDSWRAVATRPFPVGSRVRITGTDGNKVIVVGMDES